MKVDFISQKLFDQDTENLIERCLQEDIGDGDHTSLATIPNDQQVKVALKVKDRGIIAGISLAEKILRNLDANVVFEPKMKDGAAVSEGDIAFYATGNAYAILCGERLLLNFMQRLSGVATKTHHLASLIKDYPTKLLDTRKTTPGLRFLEKWAVKIGGGYNHRIGLFDMILIKDNHIDAAGGIIPAMNAVKSYLADKHLAIKVEIEIRTFKELEEILETGGADRLLLDNFSPGELSKAVKLVNGRVKTEASGRISEGNIVEYAQTGVDYISSGSLTYSVRALDLSLKVI